MKTFTVLLLFPLLLCGALASIRAQTPATDPAVQALEQSFATLDAHAQQLLILERLPGAVGKRAEFDCLLSKLSLDLPRPEDSGSLARCIVRLQAIQTVTPGALLPNSRTPDYSTPWGFYSKMKQFLVKDRAGFDQDFLQKFNLGQTIGDAEGLVREMVAWGRQHGTDASLLSTTEAGIAQAKQETAAQPSPTP